MQQDESKLVQFISVLLFYGLFIPRTRKYRVDTISESFCLLPRKPLEASELPTRHFRSILHKLTRMDFVLYNLTFCFLDIDVNLIPL